MGEQALRGGDRLEAMARAIVDGDDAASARLAQEALQGGGDPLGALEGGFLCGLREAGRLFDEGEFFLPELVTAAQAMQAALSVLRPALAGGSGHAATGRVVIGTIAGDIHDIGKTLVAALLRANGFDVYDEGVDVPIERFIDRAREVDADLVCASALLTTTMVRQRDLVAAVREAGLRARVLVGGAPVTRRFAEEIGADGFADNAVAAAALAIQLVSDAAG